MNLMETLAREYPRVQASCFGDATVYSNIKWDGGDPLPTESELVNASYLADQAEMWEKIKMERDRRKANGVQVGDVWFHSDDTSRIQQIGLVMMGTGIPAGLMWKSLSGYFVEMTPTLAKTIFQSIAMQDTQIFAVAEQHRKNMLQSASPAEYDFSTNWPPTYTG